MSLFDTAVFNSTLYEALYLQIGDTLGFARDFFGSCVSSLPIASLPDLNFSEFTFYEGLAEVLYFNEFQCLLLKTFSLILLFTLLLIIVSWRVYGKRISERFMRPENPLTVELQQEGVPYDIKLYLFDSCCYFSGEARDLVAKIFAATHKWLLPKK